MSTIVAPHSVFVAADLEDALMADLKARLPEWCDSLNVARPRGWEIDSQVARHAESQTPTVVVVVPGVGEQGVERTGRGIYGVNWLVDVNAIVSARREGETRRLAQAYGACIRETVIRCGSLGGVVSRRRYMGERYDLIDISNRRTLMGATVLFSFHLDDVLQEQGPQVPSQQWPTVRLACANEVVRLAVNEPFPGSVTEEDR